MGSAATGNTAASSLGWRAGFAPVYTSTRDPRPASTGHDADSGAELKRRRHGGPLAQLSLPAGNAAENLTEARGSAVISAIESRQAHR